MPLSLAYNTSSYASNLGRKGLTVCPVTSCSITPLRPLSATAPLLFCFATIGGAADAADAADATAAPGDDIIDILGSFVLGFAASIGIFYAAVQVAK